MAWEVSVWFQILPPAVDHVPLVLLFTNGDGHSGLFSLSSHWQGSVATCEGSFRLLSDKGLFFLTE